MTSSKKHAFALHTEIHINASSDKVWQVLTDFESYPQWNPFIKSLIGDVQLGNTIKIHLQPENGSAMKFSPKIMSYEPGFKFSWLGRLGMRGIFDGEHHFECHANEDGSTTLRQFEYFDGLLVPFFKKNLKNNTKADFERLNEAIKERAEAYKP